MTCRPAARLALFACLMTCVSAAGAADNWPQIRGPGAAGTTDARGLPTTWSATQNVAWTADVAGLGWPSPVVWGDRVFLTTCVKDGQTEKPQMGLYLGKSRGGGTHHWRVLCLDLPTGKTLWDTEVHAGEPKHIHLKNSFASETPCTDGERVYAHFGQAGMFCLDFTGKVLWSARIPPARTRLDWGSAASPVVHGDRVYLVNDNEEDSYLLALDKRTGKEIWRVPRERETNWSTPFVWQTEKRTEIVVPASRRVVSYDLDGKELWSLKGMSTITIATPYTAHGLLYVSSGYFQDKLRPIYAIRPGAAGDITLNAGQTSSAHVAWCQRTAAPYNPTTVVYGDHLYVLLDRGFFACYDARTGALVYDKKRIDVGGSGGFTASPWAGDGKVYCLSEAGQTTVVQAGPEFKVLAENPLEDPALATPAIAGDSFLVRTASRLYRVRGNAAAK